MGCWFSFWEAREGQPASAGRIAPDADSRRRQPELRRLWVGGGRAGGKQKGAKKGPRGPIAFANFGARGAQGRAPASPRSRKRDAQRQAQKKQAPRPAKEPARDADADGNRRSRRDRERRRWQGSAPA